MACYSGKLNVTVLDPRITFNLVEGEELLTCPYDSSHAVLPSKFSKHLNNCRAHHCEAQRKKNKEPEFCVCQFDKFHHVPKELLQLHEEETCPSRFLGKIDDWSSGQDWSGTCDDDDDVASIAASVQSLANQPSVAPYSPQALEALLEEDWETEPAYDQKFDPEQAVQEKRSHGYIYIKTDPLVGLTKTQKKEFYAKEVKDIKTFTKAQRTQVVQRRAVLNELAWPQAREAESPVSYRSNATTLRTTKDQRLAIFRERLRPGRGFQDLKELPASACGDASNFRREEEEEEDDRDPFSPRQY